MTTLNFINIVPSLLEFIERSPSSINRKNAEIEEIEKLVCVEQDDIKRLIDEDIIEALNLTSYTSLQRKGGGMQVIYAWSRDEKFIIRHPSFVDAPAVHTSKHQSLESLILTTSFYRYKTEDFKMTDHDRLLFMLNELKSYPWFKQLRVKSELVKTYEDLTARIIFAGSKPEARNVVHRVALTFNDNDELESIDYWYKDEDTNTRIPNKKVKDFTLCVSDMFCEISDFLRFPREYD